MTTWTGNKANQRRNDYLGKTIQKTYSIAGVAGDTGGTLTCTGLKILKNYVLTVYKAAAGVAAAGRITDNTVVVEYVNPAADHTVRITVWGVKG